MSFWRPRPSEHSSGEARGAEHNGPLCRAATGPEAGDFHLWLPAKQHGATETTTHPLTGHPVHSRTLLAVWFSVAGWQLGARRWRQVGDRGSQQQPTKGTLRHSYCPDPLLKTLIALLPCLLRMAKLCQTHHSPTQLQEPNPELIRKLTMGNS